MELYDFFTQYDSFNYFVDKSIKVNIKKINSLQDILYFIPIYINIKCN